ncbi:MFS transporter [Massilia sp. UBA6681]|uniref:MFS transporter n=1 Tax=Massilia sp. UBA6681 TaxID=1946839 RepID=UPI0025BB22A3|nr:MFS transporter [Massilia sp. UBA6681]
MTLPAVVALMVLAHTAFAGGRVALSLSAIRLGATPFEVGLVIGLLALVPMLLSVHAGRWTDRRGSVKPTLLALLLLEAGLLLALLPSLGGLGASAVLMGSGFMLVHVALHHAILAGGPPEQHTRAYSMLALGNSASSIAGPVMAGFLLDLAGGAWTFVALAALPLLALLALARMGDGTGGLPAPDRRQGRASVMDLLRHAPLRAVLVVSALLSMGWDLFSFMMPLHGSALGLSASRIGLVMGAFGAGTFVVRIFVPLLARRWSAWQVLGGALGLAAAAYLALPLGHGLPWLLACAFVLGLALGCALPMIMSAIGQAAPPGRGGEAIGIRSMLANASQTILPVSVGALGSAGGTQVVFWVQGAALAGGMLFARAQQPARA